MQIILCFLAAAIVFSVHAQVSGGVQKANINDPQFKVCHCQFIDFLEVNIAHSLGNEKRTHWQLLHSTEGSILVLHKRSYPQNPDASCRWESYNTGSARCVIVLWRRECN